MSPEAYSFTERKSLQTPYHKTGSGFIRERWMHIPEECNALLAHSAVYTHHGRAELLMYMQNYAPLSLNFKLWYGIARAILY